MSQVASETTVSIAGTADEDLVHITCCEDESRALCGGTLHGNFMDGDFDPTDRCVVCADLNRFECCPVFGAHQ